MTVNISKLRGKYPQFSYKSFKIEKSAKSLRVSFEFMIGSDIKFFPRLSFPIPPLINSLKEHELNNLIFHLGLMEILSYWKATCSPEIYIKCGFLNQEQIQWWKNLLLNGMGEFFYTNKINAWEQDFVDLKVDSRAPVWPSFLRELPKERFLVLIGGGKDSIVTLEILKREKEKGCLLLNPRRSSLKIAQKYACQDPIIIKRQIDSKLLELNQSGYLNGHTPFSAYLAFLGTMTGVLFNYGTVVVANERSAEEGNVSYLREEINHQYSKTFHFEKVFREYNQKYLAKKLNYFSLLRPLWEWQIAKLFASLPQFLSIFHSCNRGEKTNTWCGQCPKCLSTFILLYPFVKKEKLLKVFGKNLYQDSSLLPLLKALIGREGGKPFECVATYKEHQAALYLGLSKEKEKSSPPILLDYFRREVFPKRADWQKMTRDILTDWSGRHFLPPELAKSLKEEIDYEP